MKHKMSYRDRCDQCSATREQLLDNIAPKFCRVTKAARQSRQTHRRRKALGRALHQVRQARYMVRAPRDLQSVPRIVRKHAALLRHTWLVFGT